MDNITDEKLDTYITNIKNTELSNTEILDNYKKATKRIGILKVKYNKINEINKPKSKKSKKKQSSDSESEEEILIGELVEKLDKIKADLESESNDLNTMVDLYSEYHKLVIQLESQYNELQNLFYKIDTNKSNEITITKIDLENI